MESGLAFGGKPGAISPIAQEFVELIERDPAQILTLKCAYELFSQLLKQKNMPALTRAEVKVMLAELIREQFDLGLRNDLASVESQVQQCGSNFSALFVRRLKLTALLNPIAGSSWGSRTALKTLEQLC